MKNWKQFTFVAIIAIVGIIIGFIACDNSGNNDPKTFTVTFDADNGSPITTQTVNEGSKAVKPETDPIKNGFIFNYWFNVATNNEWDFNTVITADLNLKAKWDLAEPENKGPFTVSFLFQNPDSPEERREAKVMDTRTNCGSQNLEQLGIVNIIEEAIQGSFNTNATTNAVRNRFRRVFGQTIEIVIYVENTTTSYKINVPDENTIYFHVNYLTNNPTDIQENIFEAVNAIATSIGGTVGGPSLPYYVE